MNNDLISRNTLIADIKRVYCTGCNSYDGVRCRACGTGDALDMVEDAPTVDAEPVRHGRWGEYEFFSLSPSLNGYPCSNCGQHEDRKTCYCPNCGAMMDGDAK